MIPPLRARVNSCEKNFQNKLAYALIFTAGPVVSSTLKALRFSNSELAPSPLTLLRNRPPTISCDGRYELLEAQEAERAFGLAFRDELKSTRSGVVAVYLSVVLPPAAVAFPAILWIHLLDIDRQHQKMISMNRALSRQTSILIILFSGV